MTAERDKITDPESLDNTIGTPSLLERVMIAEADAEPDDCAWWVESGEWLSSCGNVLILSDKDYSFDLVRESFKVCPFCALKINTESGWKP